MPLPLLAGLPWLAGIIGAFFSGLVSFFLKRVGKQWALAFAAIALLVGLAAAFFTAITATINGLSYVTPDAVVTGAGLFMPSNTVPCMTSIVTAHALRYAYAWNVRIIQMKFIGF